MQIVIITQIFANQIYYIAIIVFSPTFSIMYFSQIFILLVTTENILLVI